jgi:hypothetical protein
VRVCPRCDAGMSALDTGRLCRQCSSTLRGRCAMIVNDGTRFDSGGHTCRYKGVGPNPETPWGHPLYSYCKRHGGKSQTSNKGG